MIEPFLLRALLSGIGIALIAGSFGSFVVWRRLAYFGDTLAHSALLGIVLGFLLQINLTLGVALVSLALTCGLFLAQNQRKLTDDTLLGIFAHGALSLGLVLLAFMENVRFDLSGYLFGDILSVTTTDLMFIYGGGLIALAGLAWLWHDLLAITIHEDLAFVEGVPVKRVNFLFLILMALTVALMMKVVGLLLVTSLLIIPAATARRFARSPESMALLAMGSGILAVVIGLAASYWCDTPTGPSIVVGACALFAISFVIAPHTS